MKFKKETINIKTKGQSLVEIVIAIALFAITIGSSFTLLGRQFSNLQLVQDSSRAAAKAEEGIEVSRNIRDRNWTELTTGNYGLILNGDTWSFDPNPDTENGFTRTINISDINSNEKQIISTVNWTPSPLRTQTITFTSILANWRNLISPRLSGNWQNPQTLGTIDLGPGNSGTSLAVLNGFVYLTATASDSKKNDFYIVDATNGQNPILKGNINTGPGLNSVAISGDYAYVANDDENSQLQIINISNPDSPVLTKSFTLTDNDEEAFSVAISNQYVYIGTEKSSGQEFFVIDVSNPLNPTITGSLEINDDVVDIFVYNDRIFITTAKDTQEFIVIDATNPANPLQVAAIDLPGSSEDGRGIYVNYQDNRAYVVRSMGGNHATHPEVAVIDVTNPEVPTTLGSLNFTADVNSVFAADNLLFLGTGFSSEEFQIFDTTNPANMTHYGGLNFPQMATDLTFENNIIYVSVRSNDALRIITAQ